MFCPEIFCLSVVMSPGHCRDDIWILSARGGGAWVHSQYCIMREPESQQWSSQSRADQHRPSWKEEGGGTSSELTSFHFILRGVDTGVRLAVCYHQHIHLPLLMSLSIDQAMNFFDIKNCLSLNWQVWLVCAPDSTPASGGCIELLDLTFYMDWTQVHRPVQGAQIEIWNWKYF